MALRAAIPASMLAWSRIRARGGCWSRCPDRFLPGGVFAATAIAPRLRRGRRDPRGCEPPPPRSLRGLRAQDPRLALPAARALALRPAGRDGADRAPGRSEPR